MLLDHGVYRSLPDQMRLDYAHLWTALIQGDEDNIKKYCARVGGSDHRLFASLLTGREWHTITAAQLFTARTEEEINRVASKSGLSFFKRITDILSTLPRVMLLLLKTGDLLRNIDEALREASSPQQQGLMTYVIMGRFCAKAVWLNARQVFLDQCRCAAAAGLQWQLVKDTAVAWWRLRSLECNLYIYSLQLTCMHWWHNRHTLLPHII